MLPDSVQITTLLHEWRQGNATAGERFLGLVYDELRGLAARYLHQERRNHTLQPTALVHELYLRLFRFGTDFMAESRPCFCSRGSHIEAHPGRLCPRSAINQAGRGTSKGHVDGSRAGIVQQAAVRRFVGCE